ncbi:LEA type 2 family protein [Desulfococcaceae bacterium HSG8]|nr:LEA type 2 family protein [Desulfococcaceae bacterium HSG8]
MHRKTALFILSLTMMAICGCATLQQLIQKPVVQFKDMSLKSTSFVEGDFVFRFDVKNPNPIGATIRNIVYDLRFDDKTFIRNSLEQRVSLPANGSNTVELPVTVNYLELFQSVEDFIRSKKLAYDLSGSIGVGPFDIPYHKKGNFVLPRLPKISMGKVRISDLSFTGASVVFSLDMKNTNPFALDVSGLNYNIKLGGIKFAEGTAANISPISKSGKTTMEIPIHMNFFELGQSAYRLLKNTSSEYELTGEMMFEIPGMGEKGFPFKRTGRVSFGK